MRLFVVVNHCAVNRCQHHGKCTSKLTGFTCKCAAGYNGHTCETGKLDINGQCMFNIVTADNILRFQSLTVQSMLYIAVDMYHVFPPLIAPIPIKFHAVSRGPKGID